MARPCVLDHAPSPHSCRLCWWCADPSEQGRTHRRMWDEPEPAPPPGRDLIPGVPDPIPDPPPSPVPAGWARDPVVMARHRAALSRLSRQPLPPPGRSGSGVVLFGGGKWWVGNVVAVRMLRDTGCRLPVQIWHRGTDEPVRPSDLVGLGAVTVHDLTAIRPAPRRVAGWEAKTVALLACGWERVFFHDSDAYCLCDPTELLDWLSPEEPFLYWEDLPGTSRNVNWAAWALPGDPIPAVQGGQCAVHLTHFWREFVLAYWIDQHSDFSYAHQYGDQDSWRVALARTGGRYGRLGHAGWDRLAFTCSYGGRPFVVHRCQAKMFAPEHAGPGDQLSNRRLDRLPGEARAWEHYDAVLSGRPAAEVFGQIHARGAWAPGERSGAGSTPEQAAPYLETVNALARVGGWRRVVDLGCGDGYIASRLEAPEVVGVDCHRPHVERLGREFPHREWLTLDLDRDREALPSGDVALLKDVLHHWPNRLVREWLTWARGCGKWRWLVCTQDRPHPGQAADCALGGLRGLDPAAEVFRDLGLFRVADYLGKSVLMLTVSGDG